MYVLSSRLCLFGSLFDTPASVATCEVVGIVGRFESSGVGSCSFHSSVL